MPTDLFTRKQVDSRNAIPVVAGGRTIGFISPETYEELGEPDTETMTFETTEEEDDEKQADDHKYMDGPTTEEEDPEE